jgi:hypothetical protein
VPCLFALPPLIVRGLSAAAGTRPLLADVDLTVAPGDRLGLVTHDRRLLAAVGIDRVIEVAGGLVRERL